MTDVDGKPLTADYTYQFFVLTGDVNADRVVNDRDLYAVWQNLLKPAAARDLNADLDGDSQVTQTDVNVVKGNYLATLAPVTMAPVPLMVLAASQPIVAAQSLDLAESQEATTHSASALAPTEAANAAGPSLAMASASDSNLTTNTVGIVPILYPEPIAPFFPTFVAADVRRLTLSKHEDTIDSSRLLPITDATLESHSVLLAMNFSSTVELDPQLSILKRIGMSADSSQSWITILPPREPCSNGRESALSEFEKSQSGLTSAATMVQEFNAPMFLGNYLPRKHRGGEGTEKDDVGIIASRQQLRPRLERMGSHVVESHPATTEIRAAESPVKETYR